MRKASACPSAALANGNPAGDDGPELALGYQLRDCGRAGAAGLGERGRAQ